MGIEYIGYFLLAIICLFVFVKVFSWPLKIFFKLVVNAILGAITLWIVNFIGSYFGLYIAINIFTALIVGFLGVPGVILLIIIKFIG